MDRGRHDSTRFYTSCDQAKYLVHIRLKRGHDLIAKDISGKSDPYVEFKQDDSLLYKSSTVLKTVHPVWDEEFDCIIDNLDNPIELSIFDWNRFTNDDFMGTASIDIGELELARKHDLTLMVRHPGAADYLGHIDLIVEIRQAAGDDVQDHRKRDEKSFDTVPDQVKYLAHIRLKHGHDLIARDISGKSDPYVEFKQDDSLLYKSSTILKTVHPVWDEAFDCIIDNLENPIELSIFDWNRFINDDFMGTASIDISELEHARKHDLMLMVRHPSTTAYLGYINLVIQITEASEDDIQSCQVKKSRSSLRRRKKKVKTAFQIVNITLIEARDLCPVDLGSNATLPCPYVKFKLGSEKYKSKPCDKTIDPQWLDQFDLSITDESQQDLQIIVIDKSSGTEMGRSILDLSTLPRESAHKKWYQIGRDEGEINLFISITGTIVFDIPGEGDFVKTRKALLEKYSLPKTLKDIKDVGTLIVKVYKATNLESKDLSGLSDPFCALELVNARLRTHAANQTVNPNWNKVFTFKINDIHTPLHVYVYDEDNDGKVDFLGRVVIPLLRVRNGEPKWYALKDEKLQKRTKGQILLELNVIYNPVRAILRTFNAREECYVADNVRFKPAIMLRLVNKLGSYGFDPAEMQKVAVSCLSWENPIKSLLAFIGFEAGVYYFQPFMIPLMLLLVLTFSCFNRPSNDGLTRSDSDEMQGDTELDGDSEEKNLKQAKATKKSMKQKLNDTADLLTNIQIRIQQVVDILDQVKNTINFTEPFLSYLAMAAVAFVTILLYFIPIRIVVMLWGAKKFTRKLRDPVTPYHHEIVDFLSRVPTDDNLDEYSELMPDTVDPATARQIARGMVKRSSLAR